MGIGKLSRVSADARNWLSRSVFILTTTMSTYTFANGEMIRQRKMKRLTNLGYAIVLSMAVTIVGAIDSMNESTMEDGFSLGRNRLPSTESSFRRTLASNNEMGDFWEKASRAARSEIEALRLLHSEDMMSMSLSSSNDVHPQRPPVPSPKNPPTLPPIRRPVPAPVPTPLPTPIPISTAVPTQAPTPGTQTPPTGIDCKQPREEYLFDLLKMVTPPETLLDLATPHGKAYAHLVNSDTGISDHCSYTTIEQRYGLTTFYFATNGADWTANTGWLGKENECSWFGVDCGESEDSQHVTKLVLPDNNLVGTLPEEMRVFKKLQRFDVFLNSLTGTLPKSVSTLQDLVLLDLEENKFSGPAFPEYIFELKSLASYRISDNKFSGNIPSEISKWDVLCQLWAAGNLLTGTIPKEIATSTKLESIILYENKIEGSIPTELGTLGKLKELILYNNTLQNEIPKEIFSATALETLRLDFNFLSGALPAEVGKLANLTDLRLFQNSLFGTVPKEIGALTKLENFIINNNFWTGALPDVFQDLSSLDYIDVSNAKFKGPIPPSLFKIPTLRIAYLSNNTFSGTIPQDFASASLMRDLFLDGNSLTGTVPDLSTGQFQSLTEFLVQYNYLTGTMPESFCDLREEGRLNVLFADCGGVDPEIECDFPTCCNRCFEAGTTAMTRRKLSTPVLRSGR